MGSFVGLSVATGAGVGLLVGCDVGGSGLLVGGGVGSGSLVGGGVGSGAGGSSCNYMYDEIVRGVNNMHLQIGRNRQDQTIYNTS